MSFVDGFLNLFKVQDDEFDDDYDYDEEFDDDEDDDDGFPPAFIKNSLRTQEERLFQLSRQREVLK